LLAVRKESELPILRKDFIIDPLQLDEARLAGADAILLIVRILTDQQLELLLAKAKELGLAALVEIHNASEARRALAAGAEIIGINNRDLDTLQTDWHNTLKVLNEVPKLSEKIIVSESGISSAEAAAELKKAGVSALLVGESLLKSLDVAAKIKELLQ
jgi:indole-3-glycerol phosphate synthase